MAPGDGDGKARARLRGADGFEAHHGELFGARWPGLRTALLASEGNPTTRCVRLNAFADLAGLRELALEELSIPGCYRFPRDAPVLERDQRGLVKGYVMDPASVVAARALPLEGASAVLDLCAAPGGKSLILAERAPKGAKLWLNDRSPQRRLRLKQVLRDHLPTDVRGRISVTALDGRSFGMKQPGAFDAVLLDAPCSSEEHVLADRGALSRWSTARSERLSRDQYALLAAALLALRPGGVVLYVTCALSPLENDGVVRRMLERGRHSAELEPISAEIGAKTELGWHILPDESGFGPMYFALLRKAAV